MTLDQARPGQHLAIERVGGGRAFRRRLLELGLLPGTPIELIGVAPLGDPIELLVRGCSLSIRKTEALCIAVSTRETVALEPAPVTDDLGACTGCAS